MYNNVCCWKNFRFKGCDCSVFCDISQKTVKNINYLKDLNYYLAIEQDDNTISMPILLNKPIIRAAFGIQLEQKNVNLFNFHNFHFPNPRNYILILKVI